MAEEYEARTKRHVSYIKRNIANLKSDCKNQLIILEQYQFEDDAQRLLHTTISSSMTSFGFLERIMHRKRAQAENSIATLARLIQKFSPKLVARRGGIPTAMKEALSIFLNFYLSWKKKRKRAYLNNYQGIVLSKKDSLITTV